MKYGDQLGSNCLNGPLFACNRKVLEDFFEFYMPTCIYLSISKDLLIFFATYVHMHHFAPLTSCVLLKRFKL